MIIDLPVGWIILVNILAIFTTHMLVTYAVYKIPLHRFSRDRWLYRCRGWEKNGQIWEKWFRVKNWKNRLPDGAALFRKGFRKKNLRGRNQKYYQLFIQESRRGELTHWLTMLPAPLFFLWNPAWAGWVIIVYSLLANLPCILAQRYNRPRFTRLLQRQNI